MRGVRHMIHGMIERGLVGLGRACETRQLAHELQRRRADLIIRRGGLEIVQGLDAARRKIAADRGIGLATLQVRRGDQEFTNAPVYRRSDHLH
jgi:hypothetical protein